MKVLFATLSMLLVSGTAASGAVELSKSNFEKEMAGKNGFVKFLAPW